MDLQKIFDAMIEQGIFRKGDSETDMLTAISCAASDIRWARERRAEAKMHLEEMTREGDISLGKDKD